MTMLTVVGDVMDDVDVSEAEVRLTSKDTDPSPCNKMLHDGKKGQYCDLEAGDKRVRMD